MNKKTLIFAALILLTMGLFAQKLEVKDSFEISPNPMYRYTNIYVSLDQPANLYVVVENDKGSLVKTIYNGPCDKGAVFTWNRELDDGSYAPDGFYTVIVSTDQRYTSVKKTLILK